MKQITFFIFIFFTILTNGQVPEGFEIDGEITNGEGMQLYLTQRANGFSSTSKVVLLDSCVVKNGKFKFRGRLNEPNYYSVLDNKGRWQYFILDNNIKLTFKGNADSISRAKVTGSIENKHADSLHRVLYVSFNKSNQIVDSITEAYAEKDTVKANFFTSQYKMLILDQQKIQVNFIKEHPSYFESLYQFSDIYKYIDKAQAIEIYNIFPEKLKQHSIGKKIRYWLFEIEKIYDQSVYFSQADSTGKIVSIDTLKSNYILVDFWASWCGPCRGENPNLKKAYEKYKSKGFEIVAISLDSEKESWLNAIRMDHLNWIQLSDLKGWNNELAKKYAITSIPSNFLLDKDRKIISKNLRGEKLLEKLTELYE